MANPRSSAVKKIAGAIAVILIFVAGTSMLMTTLRSAKMASYRASMEEDFGRGGYRAAPPPEQAKVAVGEPAPRPKLAHVKTFAADIDLTPRLSVGTDQPESIYETKMRAEISATGPEAGKADCEIQLPLPPQLISLADVTVTINGKPDDSVLIEGDKLIWRGPLDREAPTKMEVTYTAMGKGIYTLTPPTGRIVDVFETRLTANRSDIRVLELSLQPDRSNPEPGKTSYTWKYKRLMFGRPIALDVLGIAPVDRLGELGWLGPISVLVFGLLVALVALAYQPEKLDKWMLLLLVGAFAGAYPLMYFAQDFLSVGAAVIGAAAVVLAVIGIRGMTLFGTRLGLFGTVVLAAAVQAITVCAALWPKRHMLGVLLTLMAIGTLVAAMVMLPRAQKNLAAEKAAGPPAPPPPPP